MYTSGTGANALASVKFITVTAGDGSTTNVPAYCVNSHVDIRNGQLYIEDGWKSYISAGFPTIGPKVMWITQNAVPNANEHEVTAASGIPDLTRAEVITGAQFATWWFTNPDRVGDEYPALEDTTAADASSQRIIALMNWYVHTANDPTTILPVEPGPTLSLTSSVAEGTANTSIGPIVVATTGSASLAVSDGTAHLEDRNGATVTSAVNGEEVFLVTAAGTEGRVIVTAQGVGTPIPLGRMFVGEPGAPKHTQEMIVALDTVVPSSAAIAFDIRAAAGTGSVRIHKQDAADGTKALGEAEFDVVNSDGEIVAHVITDVEGNAVVDGLPFGTYTVHERVAPAGYDLDATPRSVSLATGEGVDLTILNRAHVVPAPTPTGDVVGGGGGAGGTLAATGSDLPDILAVIGSIILLLGSGLLIDARRRARKSRSL